MATTTDHSVTKHTIDTVITGATPQFALQIKARVWALIEDLEPRDPARTYGEAQMRVLDRLANATTRGERAPDLPAPTDPGWQTIPSHP